MLAQCCCAAARRGTMTDRRCRPGLLLTLFMATLALISMCAAAPDALARREQRHSGTRPLDLFVRLTSQLRFAINPHIGRTYFMQRNVQACADAVAAQSDVAAFYGLDARKTFCHTDTLPGSEEEPLTVCYYDYTEGSTYGETLRAQVNGMELALSLLLTSGALQALDDDGLAPAIMFDIDNTLQFTAQNDTDWFGLAPAIRETAAFAQRNCAGLGPSGYGPHAGQFTCYFITARGCSKSKAFATRRFVRAAFPYASDDWIDGHVLLSGGLTGCGSWSTAYKDVLRAWLEDNRGVRFVMSVGDSQSDFYGAHSGMKVHLVNSFAATNKVPEWPSSDLPWKQQYRRRDWGEKCDPHIAAPRIADDACYDAALASDDVFEAARLAHCSECEEPEELPWGRGGCKLDISALAGRGGRSSRRSRGAAARAEDVGARVVGDGRAALDLYWALVSHTRYVLEPHIGRSHIMALNVQQCRDAIAEKSDVSAYYGLKRDAYCTSGDAGHQCYDTFARSSDFYRSVRDDVADMDRVLDTIDRSGILAGVATEGRRPAIMLDVDNTLVFWIRHDAAEDPYGDAQPIQATIDFLVRRCLPDEGGDPAQYECYLVTARTCGEGVGRALAKNLQDAVGDGMTQEWLKERLLFVGSLMGCHSWEHTAIKDLARAWLEEHRNVRFVMSVGDQDTDIFGEHSGVKVKLQNAAYDARDVSAHRYTWEPEAGQYPDDGDTWRKFCSLEKAFVRSAPDFCYENALASGGFVDDISLARCMDCDPSRGEDECTLWLGDPDEDRRRHHHAGEDAFYGLASALAFMVVVVVISLAIVSLFMVATSWFASSRPRPPQPDILGSLLIPGEPLHPIGENSPAQYHEGVWRGSSAAETGAAAQLAGDGAPAEVEALLMTTLEGAGERGVARRELEAGLGAEHGAERFEYALQGLVDRGIAAEANGVVQLMM